MTSNEASVGRTNEYLAQIAALDQLHAEQEAILDEAGIIGIVNAIGQNRITDGTDFSKREKSVFVFEDVGPADEAGAKSNNFVRRTGLLVQFVGGVTARDYTARGKLMAPSSQEFRIVVSTFDPDEGQKLVDEFSGEPDKETESERLGNFALQLLRTRQHNVAFEESQVDVVEQLARQLKQLKDDGELALNDDLTKIAPPATQKPQ